jgi:phosphate transport system permease protein
MRDEMTTMDSRSAGPGPAGQTPAPDGGLPRTTLPKRTKRSSPPQRRPLTMIRLTDVVSLIGALAAAVTTTGLLWQQVSPFSGFVGAVVVTWLLFVIYYAVLIAFDEDRMTVRDRIAAVMMWSLALLIAAALFAVIYYTFLKGFPALKHLNFYTQDGRTGGPLSPLTTSGALHAIIGTLVEVGIAMAIAVPLGVITAVFMNEVPGRYASFIRTVIDAMTAMPDILAGLFIFATLIAVFGWPLSGACAGIALGITALPIICRASDVVLRLMPGGLTEASYALGAGQWRTVRLVTLPTVKSGLSTAVILGVARAIGETAPVLLTSVASEFKSFGPYGPMNSLPLMAYTSVQEPEPVEIARGFGAASLLLVLVLLLFVLARRIGGRGPGQLSPGQQRRRVSASKRDVARFDRRAKAVEQAARARQGWSILPGAEADGPGAGRGLR